jgi:phosphoribosylanthranilate isomerase
VFIKICGITRAQDADLAADLGATAIGFIFWPGSPRYIAPEDARAIVQGKSSKVSAVGVFVNEPAERVREIMDLVQLDLAQLHGIESPEYCRRLAGLGPVNLIKAVGMKDDGTVEVSGFDPDVLVLVDAHDSRRHGGTGRTVNWHGAREIAAARPTILSGGLNAKNVGLAIASVQPYGIDVSSGVESAPGVKDADRLKRFFEALND